MRILVISDSHGRNDDIEGVLKQVGDIDMMIHCGDPISYQRSHPMPVPFGKYGPYRDNA